MINIAVVGLIVQALAFFAIQSVRVVQINR